ncbi:MAG: DNA ligase [Epsilonproteobacteria bacterium]|nr:DNA ligase [Campylobacterota bacterium]|tara:strand:+ start:380 stop:2119 length:1740 start_codon:yes stop_codon:yes gene_type:complete
MKFSQVAQIFEKIEQESSRTQITQLLADLLQQASVNEVKILSYLSLGSLFPPYKSLQFNIAKKGMIEIIAVLLNKSSQQVQEQFKVAGDLGSVVHNEWHSVATETTIEKVYETLIVCAQIAGTGSTEKKQQCIIDLLHQVDPLSAKYIVRIVNGTLRLGFSDMTVLDALSWMEQGDKSLRKDLEHAYNICADLGLVAYTLKQYGLDGIRNMKIQVGIPVRLAAAERLSSAQAVIDKLGASIAQPKLDGFRVQVHKLKNKVHFFSRNLLDMSEMFPDLKQAIASLPVDNFICEGEAIVFDEDTETFLPFQETVKRKRKHGIDKAVADFPLRLYVFDMLYVNDVSLLNKTHKQRRAMLQEIIGNSSDEVLQVIEEKKVTTAEELQDYFLLNIQGGLEGLVIKREDAIYQPGKRNFNWIKLKRHARGQLVDTIDCVILGYYYGKGKRTKFGIGAFLVGIYNATKDIFQSVAKIGTGMTDEEWQDLKQRCEKFEQKEKPHNIEVVKDLYPDVWVTPEIVCTVQSDEITLSPVHSAGKTNLQPGLALRFPRFIMYRDDKDAVDATTDKELYALYNQQKIDNTKA